MFLLGYCKGLKQSDLCSLVDGLWKWMLMWGLTFVLTFLCGMCACEEWFSRPNVKGVPPPAPVSALFTPSDLGEEKAPCATSDRDVIEDRDKWDTEISDHGIFDAARNAHFILVNGDHANRLGKRICKRTGAKIVTLLSGGELFSGGERVKPSEPPWASTFLCTHRREPYIQSRGDRRCHSHDCFRSGAPLTLRGTSAKRCQLHIEEALLSITKPIFRVTDDDPPPHVSTYTGCFGF